MIIALNLQQQVRKNNGNYICFLQESYNKNTNNNVKKHLQDLNNKTKRLQGKKNKKDTALCSVIGESISLNKS